MRTIVCTFVVTYKAEVVMKASAANGYGTALSDDSDSIIVVLQL